MASKDEKVMALVYEPNRDKVVSAYIDSDHYVIILDEAWEFANKGVMTNFYKSGYADMPHNLIRLPIEPSDDETECVEFQTAWISLYGLKYECPYCGMYNYVRVQQNESGKFRIGCKQCGVWFDYMFDTKDEAIMAWNARQPCAEISDSECKNVVIYDKHRKLKGLPPIERAQEFDNSWGEFLSTGKMNDGVKEFIKTGVLPRNDTEGAE